MASEAKAAEFVDASRSIQVMQKQAETKLASEGITFTDTDLNEVRQVIIEVTSEVYTDEELDAALAFYKTPLGQSFAGKALAMTQLVEVRAVGPIQRLVKRKLEEKEAATIEDGLEKKVV